MTRYISQRHQNKRVATGFIIFFQGLPTKGFPMVFHGVNGEDEREANSPSWFNRQEIMVVIDYVDQLMDCKSPRVNAESIGIISPYHQQVCTKNEIQ